MHLFLHLKLLRDKFQYTPPIEVQGRQCFEVDNFSSAEVIATAVKAVELSTTIIVYYETLGGTNLGSSLKLITTLKQVNTPYAIYYSPTTEAVEKLLLKLGAKQIEQENLMKILSRIMP